jgi:hypothetical protein
VRAITEITIRSDKRKHKWESDVSPKCTNGGILYKDKRKMMHKGWREAGIEPFNTICKIVSADRLHNPAVVQHLKVWWEQTNHVPKQKVNKNEEWANGPAPFHHLWDDYDNITGKEVTRPDKDSNGNEHRGGECTSVSTMTAISQIGDNNALYI